ncbi:MAG: hypothetical protein WC824_14800 [Bacteroidota bacterium]|jgi:polysaccharide deacetylase 2 family uncharacterized protein YibQ
MKQRPLDEEERENLYAILAEDGQQDRGVRRRIWLAGFLAALIVILFVADRYITLVQPNIERMQDKKDIQSVQSLEADVRDVLENFGIQPEWIRERSIDFAGAGHLRDLWLVQVPHDLPVASVNLDLKAAILDYGGRAFAVENARLGQIALHISFRGKIRYSLLFLPTNEVRRETGNIVLLVDGLEEAPDGEIDQYLACKEPIACILEPTRDNIALYTRVRSEDKEIVLHLHFSPASEIDSRFTLAEDLSMEELSKHLRYIVKNFPGSRFYYITSERALGAYMRHVDEIMRSLGFRALESSTLSYLDRSAQENVITARMNDLATTAVREHVAIGVVELRDGVIQYLVGEMGRLRKKGQDFVPLPALFRGE